MTRAVDEQVAAKPEQAPADAVRDSVRAALSELVNLSAATAGREVEIDQAHAASLATAEKELARVRSNLDLRVKSLHEELGQKSEGRAGQIAQQYQSNLDDLRRGNDARKQ